VHLGIRSMVVNTSSKIRRLRLFSNLMYASLLSCERESVTRSRNSRATRSLSLLTQSSWINCFSIAAIYYYAMLECDWRMERRWK
jgi:hypothetical protein